MQVVSGYDGSYPIRFVQRLRLYHLSRPSLKKWRASRHSNRYDLDWVDRWVLNFLKPRKIIAVDCAGWYFNVLGVDTDCIESDEMARYYCPEIKVEPDLFIHRPNYVDANGLILFKYPWFLKYSKLDAFQNFLKIWCLSEMVLNFDPMFVQHNHLKYRLINIVKETTDLKISEIGSNLWLIKASKGAC